MIMDNEHNNSAMEVHSSQAVLKHFMRVSFVIYLVALLYFTLGKSPAVMVNGSGYHANTKPLQTIKMYQNMFKGSPELKHTAFLNLFGNLVLLLPMAVYLPYFIKVLRNFTSDFLVVLTIIVAIELIEFYSHRGTFDIDDIILNAIGAIAGYVIWKICYVIHLKRKHENTPVDC